MGSDNLYLYDLKETDRIIHFLEFRTTETFQHITSPECHTMDVTTPGDAAVVQGRHLTCKATCILLVPAYRSDSTVRPSHSSYGYCHL